VSGDPLLNQGPQPFIKGPERSASDPLGQSPQGTQASGLEASVAALGSLVVHAALGLVMLLAIDIKEEEPPVVQAELWSSLPAELAANAPVAPPPTPSSPAKEPNPPQPNAEDAEIALAKKKAEEEERRRAEEQAEQDRLRKAKEAAEQKRLAEERAERDRIAKEKVDRVEKERLARLEQARLKKEREDAERRKKLAEEKAARERAELEQRRREATERIRQEQLAQVKASLGQDPKAKAADKGEDVRTKAGVAGGAEMGDRTGVLADYAAAIRARIRSRISFDPARAPDNPEVLFVVEQQATGRVTKVTKRKSSGNAGWDAAVERAIWGSSPLPKTADGQVENPLTLAFRPLDRPQTSR
jgi:colicin import membrane protein